MAPSRAPRPVWVLGVLLPALVASAAPVALPPTADHAWGVAEARSAPVGGDPDAGLGGVVVAEGDVFMAGAKAVPGLGSQLLVQRWDRVLGLVWERTSGGGGADAGASVAVAGDAVYVTGTAEVAGDVQVVVQRWSLAGDLVWSTFWGAQGADAGRGIAADAEGAYVVGSTSSQGAGGSDALALAVSPDGAVRWSIVLGNEFDQVLEGTALEPARPFLHAVGSWRSSDDPRYEDGYYVEFLTSDGSPGVQRLEGRSEADHLYGVVPIGAEEVVMVGTQGLTDGGTQAWALRVHPTDATPLWERSFALGPRDTLRAVARFHDRFVAVGTSVTAEGAARAAVGAWDFGGILAYAVALPGTGSSLRGLAAMDYDLYAAGAAGAEGVVAQLKECSPNGALSLVPEDLDAAPTWAQACLAQLE